MTRRVMCVTGALLSCFIVAIHGQAVPKWPTYSIKQAPTEWRPAIERADSVIASIQSAASTEVRVALASGDPGDAMHVCHLSATTLIQRIGREQGIAAGRTSARLRTPVNAPRPWAAPIVKQYADVKIAGVDGFAVDLGDKIGVMRPIAHRAACSPCHGFEEQLNPQVRQELKDRYPVDRGTGYGEGDLRGWIWAEVPKQ